jgi:formyl-CoA transferase
MAERHGALENITVLDMGRVIAAPFCTSILADMGARVIKVETPDGGDDSRAYSPFVNGESAYFANLNRNKEGITLNLKSPEGKEILKKLVEKADVLVENFRPGVMDKLGLGYDVLKAVNPQLVYLEISGFGSYGRYSQRAGYDLLAQAMGGMMSLTGPKEGDPTRAGTAIGDLVAGINGALGILAALNARSIIGHGQKVDVALLDSIVVLLENYMTRYRFTGEIQPRNGNAYPAIAPYDSYHAKDGDFVIGVGNQSLFTRLVNAAGHPEWLEDERFCTNLLRVENMDQLKVEIEKWAADYTVAEAVEKCLDSGVPAAPIYDLSQVMRDPHLVEDRGMFPEMDHPVIGKHTVNGWAIKMSDTMPRIWKTSPLLGEDTESVLTGLLGYTAAQVKEFRTNQVV